MSKVNKISIVSTCTDYRRRGDWYVIALNSKREWSSHKVGRLLCHHPHQAVADNTEEVFGDLTLALEESSAWVPDLVTKRDPKRMILRDTDGGRDFYKQEHEIGEEN